MTSWAGGGVELEWCKLRAATPTAKPAPARTSTVVAATTSRTGVSRNGCSRVGQDVDCGQRGLPSVRTSRSCGSFQSCYQGATGGLAFLPEVAMVLVVAYLVYRGITASTGGRPPGTRREAGGNRTTGPIRVRRGRSGSDDASWCGDREHAVARIPDLDEDWSRPRPAPVWGRWWWGRRDCRRRRGGRKLHGSSRPVGVIRPTSSALACQSRAQATGSYDNRLDFLGSRLAKYRPVTPSTSGEDAS